MPNQLTLTQVEYGCAVTQHAGTPNMTVDVAAGSVIVGNVSVSVAATTLTIGAASYSQDRVDAVVVNSSGVASVIAGSYYDDNIARAPDTTGYALIAYVYVFNQQSVAYTGTILNSMIDGRLIGQSSADVRSFALRQFTPYQVSGNWYSPQASDGTGYSLATGKNAVMYAIPWNVLRAVSIQALGFWLSSTTANAGAVARLGLYSDDGKGVLTLLVDAGTVAVDAGAGTFKTKATSQTLAPGDWWLTLALQSFTSGLVGVGGVGKQQLGFSPVGLPNPPVTTGSALTGVGCLAFSGVSGALPTSPTSPSYSETAVPAIWAQAT